MKNNTEKTNKLSGMDKITGDILLPGSQGFDEARKVWNGAIDKEPAIIFLPDTAEKVSGAVKFASENNLSISIRGGGHDWSGRSASDNGVLINMSKMKNIAIDAKNRTAKVDGGIHGAELVTAAESHGLVAVAGCVGVVGFAGMTLGGGYGPLLSTYGLALDNVISATLVLADGSIATASEHENQELFWAIRGGGGAFGIVVSLTVKLFDEQPTISGMIQFKLEDAPAVLEGYNELMRNATPEIGTLAAILAGPDGNVGLAIVPFWSGDEKAGFEYVEKLKKLGNPVFSKIDRMKYSDFLHLFDHNVINGQKAYLRTLWLPDLGPEEVKAISTWGKNMTSRFSMFLIHHFNGKAASISPDATAFGFREPHYWVEAISGWEYKDAADDKVQTAWADSLFEALNKNAFPGGYVNNLSSDNDEQARYAFGTNLARLQAAKKKFDPNNVFKGMNIFNEKV